jgi:hypothetical protein
MINATTNDSRVAVIDTIWHPFALYHLRLFLLDGGYENSRKLPDQEAHYCCTILKSLPLKGTGRGHWDGPLAVLTFLHPPSLNPALGRLYPQMQGILSVEGIPPHIGDAI